MIRIFFLTALLFNAIRCFSSEETHDPNEWVTKSLLHIAQGNTYLYQNNPHRALTEFEQAHSVIDISDRSAFAIGFFARFGEIIAYDRVGSYQKCKESIGSLFLSINNFDEDGSEKIPDHELQSDFARDEASIESLRSLANLAPSSDVREILFSLIADVAETMLSDYKFSEAAFLKNDTWHFSDSSDGVYLVECKSFWKRAKKWMKEVGIFLHLVSDTTKKLKEIKDNIDHLRNQNPTQPQSYYVNPNYRIN